MNWFERFTKICREKNIWYPESRTTIEFELYKLPQWINVYLSTNQSYDFGWEEGRSNTVNNLLEYLEGKEGEERLKSLKKWVDKIQEEIYNCEHKKRWD